MDSGHFAHLMLVIYHVVTKVLSNKGLSLSSNLKLELDLYLILIKAILLLTIQEK